MHSRSFMRSKVIVNSHDPKSYPLSDIVRRLSQSISSRPTLTVESKPSTGKGDARHGLKQSSRWSSCRLSERNAGRCRCKPFSTNAAAQINDSLGDTHLVQTSVSSRRNGLGLNEVTEIASCAISDFLVESPAAQSTI